MIASLKRITATGWKNFTRNAGITAATVFIIVITILQITALFVFHDASKYAIGLLREKADISVYFTEKITEEEILNLKQKMSENPDVNLVEYRSKEKALEMFIEKHKADSLLIESLAEVGVNPFLASLTIRANEPSKYDGLQQFFEQPEYKDGIHKIDYFQRKSVIQKMSSIAAGISRVEIVLSVILAILAIFVAFNTIRLAIYNSREEISIMRLVGASNWFIRGPFLVQGIISGILAALLTFVLFGVSAYFLDPVLESYFSDLKIFDYFKNHYLWLFWLQIVSGVILGGVSSLVAVRKYLTV